MIDVAHFRNAVWLALSLAAVLFAFQFVYLPAMADSCRQRMFQLRRRLFLVMTSGRVAATDPAYMRLRRGMNGTIRFAEQITFTRVVLALILTRHETDQTGALIAAIPDRSAQEELTEIRLRFGAALIMHVVFTSPLAVVLLIMLLLAALAIWVSRGGPLLAVAKYLAQKTGPLAETVPEQQLAANAC